MSDESFSDWTGRAAKDPLFWLWIVSLLSPAVTAVLDLAGVIDREVSPYVLLNHGSWILFGLVLILAAARNKDLGEDKPMSTGVRVFCAVLGLFVAVVALVLGIIPNL